MQKTRQIGFALHASRGDGGGGMRQASEAATANASSSNTAFSRLEMNWAALAKACAYKGPFLHCTTVMQVGSCRVNLPPFVFFFTRRIPLSSFPPGTASPPSLRTRHSSSGTCVLDWVGKGKGGDCTGSLAYLGPASICVSAWVRKSTCVCYRFGG